MASASVHADQLFVVEEEKDRVEPEKVASGYIVGPWFDHVLIIWMPLIFLGIGGLIHLFDAEQLTFVLGSRRLPIFESFCVTLMFAHLFSTFFRSHLNWRFFRARLSRTTIGPLIVGVTLYLSPAAMYLFPILVAGFDIWHSSLQTFGFGRVYDARIGNDLDAGRWLDKGLAVLTYTGPIIGGVNAFWYLRNLSLADPFTDGEGTRLVEAIVWRGPTIAWTLTIFGFFYICFYIVWYARRARQGYKVSWQKIALYVSLTITTVIAFGFSPFDQAFFITECFHAVQYLALLVWAEQGNIARRLKIGDRKLLGAVIPAGIILLVSGASGVWVAAHWHMRTAALFVLVVGAVHYWCDGFIWSVRKGDL